jgi:glycosyltransferase involved in cell wall biosynthesis
LARNSGPGPSRNAGIEAASGEYIAFIDHDDLWEPGKLAYQADYLQSHPECAGTHTGMVAFFADGSQKVYVVKPATLSLSDTLTGSHVLPTSLMIRRAVLREVGGFGTWSRSCEDDELMIRVVAAGHRIDFQPAPLARLRRFQHGNLSSNWSQVLRARLRIAWYHRRLYRRALGPGAVRRTVSKHCWHVGNGSAPRWAGFPLRAVALLLGYRRVAESDSKGLPP